MIRSLRARVLVWYSLLLAAVIVTFATLVLVSVWTSRIADIDRQLERPGRALASALQPSGAGTFDLVLPDETRSALTDPRAYYAVWDAQGHLIDQSGGAEGSDLPRPAIAGRVTTSRGREHIQITGAGATVLAGRQLGDVHTELWRLAGILAATGILALVIALAGGWWLVGRALAPVTAIGHTAQRMSGGDLTARIPLDRVETEVEQLARSVNDAFEQLYASLQRQKQFTADASHELRTPLTTMTTEIQWALGRPRTPAEYQASLDVCLRAGARMQQCVTQLLHLARADAGAATGQSRACRLDTLTEQVLESLRPLAVSRGVHLRLATAEITRPGDPDQLREAITNLVSNAIQYTGEHGSIDVRLSREAADDVVEVRDSGTGIDAVHLPRIFDRFYRADPSRTADSGGAGLGLAVTRAIVERHGGTITCTSTPGVGSTFRIKLPNDRRVVPNEQTAPAV